MGILANIVFYVNATYGFPGIPQTAVYGTFWDAERESPKVAETLAPMSPEILS